MYVGSKNIHLCVYFFNKNTVNKKDKPTKNRYPTPDSAKSRASWPFSVQGSRILQFLAKSVPLSLELGKGRSAQSRRQRGLVYLYSKIRMKLCVGVLLQKSSQRIMIYCYLDWIPPVRFCFSLKVDILRILRCLLINKTTVKENETCNFFCPPRMVKMYNYYVLLKHIKQSFWTVKTWNSKKTPNTLLSARASCDVWIV